MYFQFCDTIVALYRKIASPAYVKKSEDFCRPMLTSCTKKTWSQACVTKLRLCKPSWDWQTSRRSIRRHTRGMVTRPCDQSARAYGKRQETNKADCRPVWWEQFNSFSRELASEKAQCRGCGRLCCVSVSINIEKKCLKYAYLYIHTAMEDQIVDLIRIQMKDYYASSYYKHQLMHYDCDSLKQYKYNSRMGFKEVHSLKNRLSSAMAAMKYKHHIAIFDEHITVRKRSLHRAALFRSKNFPDLTTSKFAKLFQEP